MKVFVAELAFLPEGRLAPATIEVDRGAISAVNVGRTVGEVQRCLAGTEIVSVSGLIAPGFVDLHTHGFGGRDLGSGGIDEILFVADALAEQGVTAFLATIASASANDTFQQVVRVREAAERQTSGAALLGIRLEGPYLSEGKRGAHPQAALRLPSVAEFDRLADTARGWLRMIDIAPELPGAIELIHRARQVQVRPCVGHTEATAEMTAVAVAAGASHCTHLFNAMPTLHHRAPGPAAIFLGRRTTTVEIIADGVHLHPATIDMIVRAKGPAHCALITDACPAAGLADGNYVFAGQSVSVREGIARLSDRTLAGSTLTMERAIRNLRAVTHTGLPATLRMAASAPASILGDGARGRIAVGARADFVELDSELNVTRTWIAGRESAAVRR